MVKVWDGFIRGFHWLLVLGLGGLYVTGDQGLLDLHFIIGYLLLALMVTRIIWGIIGSETARLSSLFHSPKAVIQSLRGDSSKVGHNPAGSKMVLVFFVLIFTQLFSGLMTTDDIMTDGPLVQYVSYDLVELAGSMHKTVIDIILVAIALHILAISVYRIKGKKLVKTLVTGRDPNAHYQPKHKSSWIAYVIFILLSMGLLFTWGAMPLEALFSS